MYRRHIRSQKTTLGRWMYRISNLIKADTSKTPTLNEGLQTVRTIFKRLLSGLSNEMFLCRRKIYLYSICKLCDLLEPRSIAAASELLIF